jgi:hypothetical protein
MTPIAVSRKASTATGQFWPRRAIGAQRAGTDRAPPVAGRSPPEPAGPADPGGTGAGGAGGTGAGGTGAGGTAADNTGLDGWPRSRGLFGPPWADFAGPGRIWLSTGARATMITPMTSATMPAA